jgi:hypothetical protein
MKRASIVGPVASIALFFRFVECAISSVRQQRYTQDRLLCLEKTPMAVLLLLPIASNMCRNLHILSKRQVAEKVIFDDGLPYLSNLGGSSIDEAKFREETWDL